jgi:hypothetical protein
MIVATVRTLRAAGYHSWAVALIAASAAAAIALLVLVRNLLRQRHVRTRGAEPAATPYTDFPVPPLPTEESTHA